MLFFAHGQFTSFLLASIEKLYILELMHREHVTVVYWELCIKPKNNHLRNPNLTLQHS